MRLGLMGEEESLVVMGFPEVVMDQADNRKLFAAEICFSHQDSLEIAVHLGVFYSFVGQQVAYVPINLILPMLFLNRSHNSL